jgi:uncharacterized protein (TIGR03437 family)
MRHVSPGEPARKGEELILSCTGLGNLEPALEAGVPAPDPPPRVAGQVTVLFSAYESHPSLAQAAPALSASAAPNEVG